jgi:Na+/proline symporter
MYEMVQNAYKVTLVGAFVPLAFGVYWKRASSQGAVCSVVMGVATWLAGEFYLPEGSDHPWAVLTPQLMGLLASGFGMIAGSLAPQLVPRREVEMIIVEKLRSHSENVIETADPSKEEGLPAVDLSTTPSKSVVEVN